MTELTLFDTSPVQGSDVYLRERGARPVQVARVNLGARLNDPQTSVEAAKQLTGKVDRAVLFHFRCTGRTFTDDQLCAELPEHYAASIKSARSRLTKSGLLRRVGTGVSARGCAAGIYGVNP
jgi:hypothetical protein